jgi:urease accessory protein UreF
LLGDPHPLLEQLGSVGELAAGSATSGALGLARVSDLPSLRLFLDGYREQILAPIELPAIVTAWHHAARGESKELIALDEHLSREAATRQFAAASYRVGQRQLGRLRPMRDQRVVQRYLAAIEAGRARGWHTLVYGVSLAMFSLPLRQGLQHYAEQTLGGFIGSAARRLHLSEAQGEALTSEQHAHVPHLIQSATLPLAQLSPPAT